MKNNIVFYDFFDIDENFSSTQLSLIKLLGKLGPLSRKEIGDILQKPRTTLYDNLLKLEKLKKVEKFIQQDGRKGRPLVFWKLKE